MNLSELLRHGARAAGQAMAGAANLARSAFGEWDAGFTGGLSGFRAGGPFGNQFYSRRNVGQWLGAYGVNSRIRGPVNRLAVDVASVEWNLYRVDPDDPEQRIKVHGHPLQKLIGGSGPQNIGRPNPWLSWRKTMQLTQTYNELAGEWFLWIRRGPPTLTASGRLVHQQPAEIWPIPPHWVASMPTWRQSKDGAVFFDPMYRFTFAGGEALEMLMSEIIWHYEPNPLNPYYRGLGAAQAVDDEISQLEWMAKYNNGFFRNSAVPGMIISLKGAKTAQLEALQSWWQTKHQGFENAFKPAFMSEETTVTNLSKDHSQLEFDASSLRLRDTVNQNWGMPPEIMGVETGSNRQAFDAALYQENHQNVRPRLLDVRDDLNSFLVPLYGEPGLFLDFENPVKESAEFILRRTNEGLTRGSLEVDEWRVANGYKPLGKEAGGGDRFIPVNVNVMLPDGSIAVGPNQSQQGMPTGSPADVVGPAAPKPPTKSLAAAGIRREQGREPNGEFGSGDGGSGPQGGPHQKDSVKSERSKKSAVKQDVEMSNMADASEARLAKAMDGHGTPDNSPMDVTVGKMGLECKTLCCQKDKSQSTDGDKLSVRPDCKANKEAWTAGQAPKETVHTPGRSDHTVAYDQRDKYKGGPKSASNPGGHDGGQYSGHEVYYKAGVGAFRLSGMVKVRDDAHLKALILANSGSSGTRKTIQVKSVSLRLTNGVLVADGGRRKGGL